MVYSMNKVDIKVGMEVWYEDTYGTVRSGKVTKFYDEHPDYVEVKGTRDNYGTQGVKICECYRTKKQLLAGMAAKSDRRFHKFCDQMKTVEDLVRFMYDTTVSCAEEYTDWDARRAAAARAKELLGIDLNA